MYNLTKNYSLKKHNSFGVEALTDIFFEYEDDDEVIDFFSSKIHKNRKMLILGSGSNTLFSKNFDGIVIHPASKGIVVTDESNEWIKVTVEAGEIWDDFVKWAVENNYGGIENLSLIPGTVGASAVQNIGAYGAEAKDVIASVETLNIDTLKKEIFTNEKCNFKYRNSFFKKSKQNKYLILRVCFQLSKNPVLNTSYGYLKTELEKQKTKDIATIRELIIGIRNSKLPDPKVLGNAGSFFKNPVINKIHSGKIKKTYPDIIEYNIDNEYVKIPAGWLIEKAGWKGKITGKVGVHKGQALVIVNHGGAGGKEIVEFSQKIQKDIEAKFGIILEPEVIII